MDNHLASASSRRKEIFCPAPAMKRLMTMIALTALAGITVLPGTGCTSSGRVPPATATAKAPRPQPSPPAKGKVLAREKGIASWYGGKFHGRKTASGERYDMNKMTAAHKTLPFGTRVRVTNLDTGRKVVVRINDRGPFIRGRVIDLSRAAARKMDMIQAGTARVLVEVLA